MPDTFLATDLIEREGVIVSQDDMTRLGPVHAALAVLLEKRGLTVTAVTPTFVSWNRSEDGAEVTLVPLFLRQEDETDIIGYVPPATPTVPAPDYVAPPRAPVQQPSRRRWSYVPEEAEEEEAYFEEQRRSIDPRWAVLQDLYPRTRKNPQVKPGFYYFAQLWQVTAPGAVAGSKAEVQICGSIGSGPKNVASNIIMQLATATHAASPLKYRNNR